MAILELPEEIIQHILSLISIKDGTRASCLSKTWWNAWRTRPILHFDEEISYLNNPRNLERFLRYGNREGFGVLDAFMRQDEILQRERDLEGFLQYGNRTLQTYRDEKIGIHKFKLSFENPIVSEWIQVALQNGVKVIELVACCNAFVLPGIIFDAVSPLQLCIESRFYSLLTVSESITISICQNIKSLHLRNLHIDDLYMQRLTSRCPMIEDLIIRDCGFVPSLKVTSNLSKLKRFGFCYVGFFRQTVEVEAPNLEFVYCSGFRYLSLGASQNLRQLKLFKVGITDEFFLDFKSRFPRLENLIIDYCDKLKRIRVSSESLRKMVVDSSFQNFLKELHVDAPNMTRFEFVTHNDSLEDLQIHAPRMTVFKYKGAFVHKVSFTSEVSNCCSHINVVPLSKEYALASTTYFVNLKGFLKNFSQSKIYLCFNYILRNSVNFDATEAMDLEYSSAAVQVHSLTLPAAVPEKFLDGLFWICRPKTIRIVSRIDILYSNECSELAEFISKYLMVARNNQDDSDIRFWSRRVKQIKYPERINAADVIRLQHWRKEVLVLDMEA